VILLGLMVSNIALADGPPPPPGEKAFYITVFLEGLYDVPNSQMRKAMDHDGNNPFPRFQGQVADVIIIELHDPNNYGIPVWAPITINLNQNGMAVANLPGSGVYYLTIKNRNHIETVSATTINLATQDLYNFSDAANKAFGSNQKLLATGVYGVYAGDVNQDGVVDGSDAALIYNQLRIAATGYIPTDIDGNGVVDGSDNSISYNNLRIAVSRIVPN
jgi:hypothetical protein